MIKMLISSLVLCLSVSAVADVEMGVSRSQLSDANTVAVAPKGFVPFLTLGSGYTGYDQELNVEGNPNSIKLLGSYYLENSQAVFDLGAGIAGQTFSQTHDVADRSISGTTAEIAARYQFSNRWQAGVVGNTLFDKGSSYGANQADAQFAGVQVLKEFNLTNKWIARVGARAMTDLNVDDRMINMYMVDLHLGWNPATQTVAKTEVLAAPARPIAVAPVPTVLQTLALKGKTPFVTFDSNKSNIAVKDQKKLDKLAQILNENSNLFATVEVIGHADSSGTTARNMELSQKRATEVAAVLNKKGIKAEQMATVAKGDSEPVAESKVAAPNRRVEIRFTGVKDTAKLEEALKAIQ